MGICTFQSVQIRVFGGDFCRKVLIFLVSGCHMNHILLYRTAVSLITHLSKYVLLVPTMQSNIHSLGSCIIFLVSGR